MRRNQNIEKHPVETIQRLVNFIEKIMNFYIIYFKLKKIYLK